MPDHPASIHVLGGRQFGGADQFYVRLIRALREAGQLAAGVYLVRVVLDGEAQTLRVTRE